MKHYPYLIIGGGITGVAAIRGIRKVDSDGKIGMISSEAHAPYKRPFLSKSLWKGTQFSKVWIDFDQHHVDLYLSKSVARIDRKKKQVFDKQGTAYSYDKLLLATGGTARHLPWDVPGLIYFRDLDDYLALKGLADEKYQFVVIGGGFIGSEIAAALSMASCKVTMLFPEESIGARVYPKALSGFLNDYYEGKGITVLTDDMPASISRHAETYKIQTKGGKELRADGVIVGIGIQCNTELADQAGLEIENGILINERLQTSDPDIYAAGDVASFYNPALAKRIRVEHEDNANVMGEAAGLNMAGKRDEYHHLPFFYSDLFDLGYEAVGTLDARLELVEDWQEEFRKGVVYYLESERVRGVLLWNTWGHMEEARALIASPGPFNAENLKGRIGQP
ncbi:MAG TPA: FAD-dependent oxidoreductase, partial [Mariprofundaceae bacterium]|nr:FAD-dependent oxidoreductase [Mariprofundaceae bacterium]